MRYNLNMSAIDELMQLDDQFTEEHEAEMLPYKYVADQVTLDVFKNTSQANRYTLYQLPRGGEGANSYPQLPKMLSYYLALGMTPLEAYNEGVTQTAAAWAGLDRDVATSVDNALTTAQSFVQGLHTSKGMKRNPNAVPLPKKDAKPFDKLIIEDYKDVDRESLFANAKPTPKGSIAKRQKRGVDLTLRNFLEVAFNKTDYLITQPTLNGRFKAQIRESIIEKAEAEPDKNIFITQSPVAIKEGVKFLEYKKDRKTKEILMDDNGNPQTYEVTKYRPNEAFQQRTYLVAECDDKAIIERFTTFAFKVSKGLPLIAVVDSGGKSLHFWFNVRGMTRPQLELVANELARHGADPQPLKTISQLVRLPSGGRAMNSKGELRNEQKLLFLDPAARTRKYNETLFLSSIEDRKLSLQEELLENVLYVRNQSAYYSRVYDEELGLLTDWSLESSKLLQDKFVVSGVNKKSENGTASQMNEIFSRFTHRRHNVDDVVPRYPGKPMGVTYGRELDIENQDPDNATLKFKRTSFKYLIAGEFPRVQAIQGEFKTIRRLLQNALSGENCGEDSDIQVHIFLLWLRRNVNMYEDLLDNPDFSQQRARRLLNIVGENNDGKSFFFKTLVGSYFGGSSDPSGYLMQDSEFNGEILNSPLQLIDDPEKPPKTREACIAYTQRIKHYTTQHSDITIHPKGITRMTHQDPALFFARLSNESPEVLDNLIDYSDSSTMDKVLILRSSPVFEGIADPDDQHSISLAKSKIISELPAFLYWLRFDYQPPNKYIQGKEAARWGSIVYHNPVVLDKVQTQDRGSQFENLLDVLLSKKNAEFGGLTDSQLDQSGGCDNYSTLADIVTARFTAKTLQGDLKHGLAAGWFDVEEDAKLARKIIDTKDSLIGASFIIPLTKKKDTRVFTADNKTITKFKKHIGLGSTITDSEKKRQKRYYIYVPNIEDLNNTGEHFDF